jgi:hypothetical protein
MNPAAMVEGWYPTVHTGALAVTGDGLFVGDDGGNGLYRTSVETPSDASAAALPNGFAANVTALAVRGSTLYIAMADPSDEAGTTTAVLTQSVLLPGAPATFWVWSRPDANHFEPTSLFVGNQEQTWTTDSTSRALSAGAFTAPFAVSSGLTPSVTSSTPAVCTVAGTTVIPQAIGTCALAAEQPGNAAYLSAPSATVSLAITGPAPAPTPSAKLTLSRLRVAGTAIASTFVATGAGTAAQRGTIRSTARGARSTVVCTTSVAVARAGAVKLLCALRRPALALRRRQALKVTLVTTFTPAGGSALTTTHTVTVAKRS